MIKLINFINHILRIQINIISNFEYKSIFKYPSIFSVAALFLTADQFQIL